MFAKLHGLSKNALTLKYLSALGLIAVLSVASFVILNQLISTQATTAAQINISGRQRMLSQKAVVLCLQLKENYSDPDLRQNIQDQILETAANIEDSHDKLISGSRELHLPGNPSAEIQAMFFKEPMMLDQQLHTFISELRAYVEQSKKGRPSLTDPHFLTVLDLGQDTLLDSLDTVVGQYQKESENKVATLKAGEFTVMLLILIVLVFEGTFIFRPMIREIIHEREKLVHINEKLERLSTLDGLTRIPNRRCFDEFLERQWNLGIRQGSSLAVIIADIDFFKAYNDTYGHLAGDECLKRVAELIISQVKRPADLAARYGGEEFGVILGNTDAKTALDLAGNMKTAIEMASIEHAGSSVSGHVTLSFGVAACIPDRGDLPESLVRAADQALYQAKSEGRNRIVRADFQTEVL